MNTREDYLAAIDAYFNPRIEQRQQVYDKYNSLVSKRDDLVTRVNAHFDQKEEIERMTNNLEDIPPITE